MTDKRVALVTGSTSGIGAAVAQRLAAEGMRVVLNSARSIDVGRDLAKSLPEAVYVRADVSARDECRRLVAATIAEFGRLDLLVNNAGTTVRVPHGDLDAVTTRMWRDILDLNVVGSWHLTVAAVPHLRESGTGCVVNMSSVAGERPAGSSIPYAVSKAALAHLTRLLAATLGPQVRVNAIAPGLVDTPWTREFTDIRDHVIAHTPLRRVGRPEDVADMVLMLANARYTTGEVVLVDGGAHLLIG